VNGLLNEEEQALLQVYKSKFVASEDNLKDLLFKEQLDFYDDPSQFKAALCTRRAGKSYLAGTLLTTTALKIPNSTSLYIALTRASAKNILWPTLLELADQYGAEPNETDLQLKFPNGSIVWLVGADTKNFIPRLLGGKYPLAIIDEAQRFRAHLAELINDILEPALLDYKGTLVLLGTPGPTPSGYFFDATERKMHGFSVHKWSVLNNPHLGHAKDYMEKVLKDRGWTRDNPTFLREWCGVWVEDPDALLFKYKRGRNDYSVVPEGHEFYSIMGIDYGWNDSTAFVLLKYSPTLRQIYIEHAEKHPELIPSQIAIRIKQLIEKYNPIKIVADTGGLGKSITEEMKRRYGIPIHPADKREKLTNISVMNGDFIDSNLFIHDSLAELKQEYITISRGEDGLEKEGDACDLADAALYAFKEARAYAFTARPEPARTFEERAKLIEDELLEKMEAHARLGEGLEWWEK